MTETEADFVLDQPTALLVIADFVTDPEADKGAATRFVAAVVAHGLKPDDLRLSILLKSKNEHARLAAAELLCEHIAYAAMRSILIQFGLLIPAAD